MAGPQRWVLPAAAERPDAARAPVPPGKASNGGERRRAGVPGDASVPDRPRPAAAPGAAARGSARSEARSACAPRRHPARERGRSTLSRRAGRAPGSRDGARRSRVQGLPPRPARTRRGASARAGAGSAARASWFEKAQRRGGFAPLCYGQPPPLCRAFALPGGVVAMAPLYDLMLLLDTGATDDQRAKVLADVESAITAEGTLVGKHDWGARNLAYEIRHKGDAEYHLFQFNGPAALLERLQRSLRLTDGVVRFRLIKLAPGTPEPPAVRPEPPRATEPEAAPAQAEAPAAPAADAPSDETAAPEPQPEPEPQP